MAKVSLHSSVLRLYGIYRGCPPNGGRDIQLGIVMELMDRGSVQTLLETLSGPPPWPLAFRLAYEIAQGMNFLHEKNILHHDLKPSNVLLDDDLHAKVKCYPLNSLVYTDVIVLFYIIFFLDYFAASRFWSVQGFHQCSDELQRNVHSERRHISVHASRVF